MKKGLLAVVFTAWCTSAFAQASLLGELQQLRGQYPTPMDKGQVAEMLNTLAWDHRGEGWGLLRKGAGNSCPLRDTFISCDILVHAPSITHWDVLMDAENSAKPQWNAAGPCVISDSSGCQMGNFLPPYPPNGSTPTLPSVPVQVPTTTDFASQVLTFINAAAGSMDVGHSKLDQLMASQLRLEASLQLLQAQLALLAKQKVAYVKFDVKPIVPGAPTAAYFKMTLGEPVK